MAVNVSVTGKSIEAVAGHLVDLTKGATAYVTTVVGTIPQDLLGVLGGDWLSQQRRRNVARMEAKTASILEGMKHSRITAPSPSVILPLMQAGADESREELQDLWAALLANSMVDGGRRVRREFFDALRHMEPLDAVLLQTAASVTARPRPDPIMQGVGTRWAEVVAVVVGVGYDRDEVTIAARNLIKLGCIDTATIPLVEPFGRMLLAACQVPTD